MQIRHGRDRVCLGNPDDGKHTNKYKVSHWLIHIMTRYFDDDESPSLGFLTRAAVQDIARDRSTRAYSSILIDSTKAWLQRKPTSWRFGQKVVKFNVNNEDWRNLIHDGSTEMWLLFKDFFELYREHIDWPTTLDDQE